MSAQISIYPLRQETFEPGDRGCHASAGIAWMSTQIAGEAEIVFLALREAFLAAAAAGHVVMTLTVSNACAV